MSNPKDTYDMNKLNELNRQSAAQAEGRQVAEEDLNLQLKAAKQLADFRRKLMRQLLEEARTEGKLVEEYLAEYGLQKRLDALASLTEAEKLAGTEREENLQALRLQNTEDVANLEAELEKKRLDRQAKESKAKDADAQAKHKQALADIQAQNKAAQNISANVTATVDFNNVDTSVDLEVTPSVADIFLPEAELAVKAKVDFDPAIPTEVEISAKVIPEIPAIEPLVVDATIQPILGELPQVPDLVGNLKLVAEVPEVGDLSTTLKVAAEVEPIADQTGKVVLTPEIPELAPVELEADVLPKVAGEVELPELVADLKVQPTVDPIPQLDATAKVVPIVEPVPSLESELKLIPNIDPIADQTANLKLATSIDPIPEQETTLKLVSSIDAVPAQEAELKLTPVVDPVTGLTSTLSVTPEVEDIALPEATLPVNPVVAPIPELTSSLKVTPEVDQSTLPEVSITAHPIIEPVQDLEANLKLLTTVEPVEDQEGKLLVTPELTEPLQLEPQTVDVTLNTNLENLKLEAQSADLNLIPNIKELPEQTAAVKLTPVVDPIPEQEITGKLIIDKTGLSNLEADVEATISADTLSIPALTAEVAVTPKVLPIEPLDATSIDVTPVVAPVEPIEIEANVKTKVEALQELTATLKLIPEIDSLPDLTAKIALVPEFSELDGIETTVKAKIESDSTELDMSALAEAEANLLGARLLGIQRIHDEELALLSLRQEVESELAQTRISSLEAIRGRALSLSALNDIPISADFGDLESSAEDLVSEIATQIKEAFNLGSLSSKSAPPSDKSKLPKATSAKANNKTDPETAVVKEYDPKVVEDQHKKNLDQQKKNITAHRAWLKNLEAEANYELKFEQSQLTLDILKARERAEIAAEKRKKLTNTKLKKIASKEDKLRHIKALSDLEAIEFSTRKKSLISLSILEAQHRDEEATRHAQAADRLVDLQQENTKLRLTTSAELLRQHLDEEAQYHEEAEGQILKDKHELYKLGLKTEEDLLQEHLDEVADREINNKKKILTASQELQKLQMASAEEKAQWAKDDAEFEKLQTLRALEDARHKTAVMQLKDEATLRAEMALDAEKHAQEEITNEQQFQKLRLHLEDQYIQARLKSAFVKEDAKYAENPGQIETDIVSAAENSTQEGFRLNYQENLAAANTKLDAEQATATQEALAEARATAEDDGTPYDEAAIIAQIEREFQLRREKAKIEAAEQAASGDAAVEELFAKRKKRNAEIEKAQQDAEKKAEKAKDKDHKKRLGQKAELADYGKAGALAGAFGTIFGAKDDEVLALQASGDNEAAGKLAQQKLDAAFDAVGDFINQLAELGQNSTRHQSSVDTRLQGLSTDEKSGGIKKSLGSYWRSLAGDIGKLGVSPFFRQQEAEDRFDKLINQGIAFNVKERAFLDVLKDKVATTFNVADGTLLKLVRIQQADTSAARLGMESALTEFLNSMYATTEYMQQAAESIRSNLYEATALMSAKEATEFEYQIQKWMGSLYSVGFSNTESLSAALGKIVAGDIGGITEGSMGNLLVMAANEAGKPIASILEKGLTAADANELMGAVVNYLAKLYNETKGSRILAQQFAGVYGVTASDLKAAANLASSVADVSKHNEDFGSLLQQVYDMTGSLITRTSTGEMIENVKENFKYSMAAALANDPVSSTLNLVANLLNDLVGGIEIPFINVYGFGFDLNATVADLMNVAALVGPTMSGIGKMIAGLSNLVPSNLLKTFGVDKGDAGLNVQTRGTTAGLSAGSLSGSDTSSSGFVGNESASDIKDKTVSDASSGPESTVAEAKEDQESKEEARSLMIAGHIVDIYELLQDVTNGTKKFRVQLDVGTNPLSWAGGTWS